tara:strand:+ start:6107 stop:7399 length:1293 start_codon:yes stop_codon:yes gene_type:complete
MEEQVNVSVAEETQEKTLQEKEAAVLEKAVEEGTVDKEYGLQDDGVYRVNLDKPPTPKEDAVQEQSTNEVSVRDGSETSEEIQKENKEESEEPTGENKQEENNKSNEEEQGQKVEDSPLELVTDEKNTTDEARVDSSTEKPEPTQEQEKILPEAKTQELPENIDKLVKFMEETGGSLEDYVSLNRDVTKMDNTTLLREYYKSTKPHLDADDVDFLFNKNFAYDEEADDPSDIKAKQLAYKEELYNAQQYFNKAKDKYYADLKLRKQQDIDPQYIKAMEYYNNSKQQSEEYNNLQKQFIEKTNKVFNDNFKGFDFKVGENKYRFKVDNTEKVKQYQSDISNFINEFLGDDGAVNDAAGYHKALFAAKNADKIANHFYEQGRADAIKDAAKDAKNINMDPRADNSIIKTKQGDKIRVVSGNSSDKLRIKWNN